MYRKVLEEEGWTMSPRQPGLFSKPDPACAKGTPMWISVYVDDSLLSGPNQASLDVERERILKRFPGRQIKPTWQG